MNSGARRRLRNGKTSVYLQGFPTSDCSKGKWEGGGFGRQSFLGHSFLFVSVVMWQGNKFFTTKCITHFSSFYILWSLVFSKSYQISLNLSNLSLFLLSTLSCLSATHCKLLEAIHFPFNFIFWHHAISPMEKYSGMMMTCVPLEDYNMYKCAIRHKGHVF